MIYLYTALTALILAAGQTFWKKAALLYPEFLKSGLTPLASALKTVFTPQFIFGGLLYAVATVVYIWLFSKYPFYIVQISMISFGIIFSFAISQIIFKEQIQLLNIFGIVLIIIGVVLVTWKR